MHTYRNLFLFIASSLLFVGLVRFHRSSQQRSANKSVHRAEIGNPMPQSPVAALLTGVNDYLWIEEGIVRGTKVIRIHVDPDVKRLLLSATGMTAKCHLVVVSPNAVGKTIPVPAPRLHSFELPLGVLIVIDQPQAGDWILQVQAKDDVLVMARAATPRGFESMESDSNFPRTGQPVHFKTRLRAPDIAQIQFHIIAKDGTLVERKRIEPVSIERAPESNQMQYEYHFTVRTPPSDFRIVASGFDREGVAFQRAFPTLYQPVR